MPEKTKVPQWVLNIGVMLIIAAYGFIFNSIIGRIETAENKIESLNTPLMQIQTDLASIKTDLTWLKQNLK